MSERSSIDLDQLPDEPWRDPDTLEEMYWSLDMTLEQIGGVLGVHWNTVQQSMVDHNIPRRKSGRRSAELDEEELRRLRVDEGLSLYDISQRLDTSHMTVRAHLKKHGIGDYGD